MCRLLDNYLGSELYAHDYKYTDEYCFLANFKMPSRYMCLKQAEFIQCNVNPEFLKDVTASPVTQRICLISMYELFGYPATWLCNFPIACRCISEQRPDLCKCHFISLAVQA